MDPPSNDGKFLIKWGSFGSDDGQFVHLHDMTLSMLRMVETILVLQNLIVRVILCKNDSQTSETEKFWKCNSLGKIRKFLIARFTFYSR